MQYDHCGVDGVEVRGERSRSTAPSVFDGWSRVGSFTAPIVFEIFQFGRKASSMSAKCIETG